MSTAVQPPSPAPLSPRTASRFNASHASLNRLGGISPSPASSSRPSISPASGSYHADSTSGSRRPSAVPAHASLQSFLEGVEFATRCSSAAERRGESRAGSRVPSRSGISRRSSMVVDDMERSSSSWSRPTTQPTRGRSRTLAEEEEAFLSDLESPYLGYAEMPTDEELKVFEDGDRLQIGGLHNGMVVQDLYPDLHTPASPTQFEIIRKLGSGSYAVVYLVRSLVYTNSSDSEEDVLESRTPTYGPEFALKCLCKHNLTEDLLEVQRFEATLHQSLPQHPNIVAMHGAFETHAWLFLLLEYCPGQDLFYWLEQARDHEELDSLMHPSASFQTARAQHRRLAEECSPESYSATPPSPTLLSITAMSSLLSRRRLRLISRMFIQICDAVDACHKVGISHRDIKPENFICCDDGLRQGFDRRVTVKITDWGLGSSEQECGDFDCGSKPYMAYECRNNLAPTYRPIQADIWSLGIVLLNLLFHRCPWSDPTLNDPDFADFVKCPVDFLNNRFHGIGAEVSEFLASQVLNCHGPRVSAGDFAKWASNLVKMMSQDSPSITRHASLSQKVVVSQAAVPLVATRPALTEVHRFSHISKNASNRPSPRGSLLSQQFVHSPKQSEEPQPHLVETLKTEALSKPDLSDAKQFNKSIEPQGIPLEAGLGSDAAILAAKAKRRKRAKRGRATGKPLSDAGADDETPRARKVEDRLADQTPVPPPVQTQKRSFTTKFNRTFKNGNPDLEAFMAKAKAREEVWKNGSVSAPAAMQQDSSFGSVRSQGSSWSTDDDRRAHWASTSSRRQRVSKKSPTFDSSSNASSPSRSSEEHSVYSATSFTSISSTASDRTPKSCTPEAKSVPLDPIIEKKSLQSALKDVASVPHTSPEKAKFTLKGLFSNK